MTWWKHNAQPNIPATPEPTDRSDDLARLREKVYRRGAHTRRALIETERAIQENHFGPRFAAALREAPR